MPNHLATADVYTLLEVAAICSVPVYEARNWFDTGRLRGWRMPETGERKVSRRHLDDFLRERMQPTVEELLAKLESAQ